MLASPLDKKKGNFESLKKRDGKVKVFYLFLCRLVSTVTEFRRSVDPLELDFLQRFATRVREHGFAEGDDAFLDAWDGAFEEEEVVLDFAVADESAHAR